VEVLCGTGPDSRYAEALRRAQAATPSGAAAPELVVDHDLGFPCHRACEEPSAEAGAPARGEPPMLDHLLARLISGPPDLVVGQTMAALHLLGHAARLGFPTFFMDREVKRQLAYLGRGPAGVRRIANSPLVADWLREVGQPDPGVVLPIVEPAEYCVPHRSRRFITFINPTPEKGSAIAADVARLMPEARFLFVRIKKTNGFVEPWREQLPNVEVRNEVDDAREVYAVTDILLHPSQWEEPFGRVILEAQASGIPVVSSDAGGIPFALGRGGILIPRAATAPAYVTALRRLRSDPAFYASIVSRALENSARPELAPERQVDEFVRIVSAVSASSTCCSGS
jgi:glycosyltransferase involved in cell wall biosynthesis